VEHRDDGEDAVPIPDADDVGHADAERVQNRRAVRVDDPLRSPRRSTRVANDGCAPLVQRGRVERFALRGEKRLVVEETGRERRVALPHDDDVPDRGDAALELGEEGEERLVDDDDAVLGVRGDVGEIVGRESQVEGMEHGAHGGDGAVRLEMPRVVPREGRNAVTGLHAESTERVR